jgi:hypothetical protein
MIFQKLEANLQAVSMDNIQKSQNRHGKPKEGSVWKTLKLRIAILLT